MLLDVGQSVRVQGAGTASAVSARGGRRASTAALGGQAVPEAILAGAGGTGDGWGRAKGGVHGAILAVAVAVLLGPAVPVRERVAANEQGG